MFKIFVGNITQNTSVESIRDLFTRYVEVEDVALPNDPETGKLRGFAIVMIRDDQKARAAMAAMRGARLNGRPLIINQARKKGAPPPKREFRRGFRGRPGGRGQSGGERGGARGAPAPGGAPNTGAARPRSFGGRSGDRFSDRPPPPRRDQDRDNPGSRPRGSA